MRFRNLVPALACLVAIPAAFAADTPAIKVDGFVDTWLSSATPKDEQTTTGFGYAAKLGTVMTISEKVEARVDGFITGYQTDNAPSTSDVIRFRNAYGTWLLMPELTLKTGKFISDYGWVAPYAPKLYRVNAGPIVSFYGVDQVGANLAYAKDALTVALTVANGFFNEGYTQGTQSPQDNAAYAWGLDVAYSLGKDAQGKDVGSVNLEGVYDEDASTVEPNSNGYHLGLNTELYPSKELTIGAELIYQEIDADDADEVHKGVLLMANYKVSKIVSVTGMYQHGKTKNGTFTTGPFAGSYVTVDEVSLAVLTSPAGTDKLGLNFEVNYTNTQIKGTDSVRGLGAAVEVLYVLP